MALDHDRHVLSCGTVVLARPLLANDIVVIHAFVPMGPLFEADEQAGISNLLQNVLPRGTAQRGSDELQEALADLGADLDSGCGPDLGSVSLRATAATYDAALDLYLETLTEPAFAPEEVETEIVQTLGELEAREDHLVTRAMDLFREQFYGTHPYHKPVPGYRDTVRALERDHVVAAARRFYRPVPPVVAAVGRFDPGRLVARLDAAFGTAQLVPAPPRPPGPAPHGGLRRLELDRDAAYLVHGYPAPSYRDPDYAAARVLNAILGGSMSSRLFIELREKRSLAYQVASLYHDQPEGSFVAGYIVTDPGRADEAAAGLEREFERLREEPVTEAELMAARRYLRGTFLIGAETNAAQAARIGRYEAYGLGQDFGDRWLAAADAVTPEAIQALARRAFSAEPTRAAIVPETATAA